MPRIARKESQSCFYHIMVQGINKEYIFAKPKEAEKFKEILLRKLERSEVTILAYCIMGNHAHILIYSDKNENISKYMQKVNTTYSQFYNKEKKRVGYVFRDRYSSQDILNERQIYNCIRYIHNNPVKAKIVQHAKDYEYSSYKEYIGEKQVINDSSIELLFGSEKGYKEQFIIIHNKIDMEEDFIDVKKDSLEYIVEIEEKYNIEIRSIKYNKELLKQVIREIRKETNVTIKELAKILDISDKTIVRYSK